jgi:hypothetical protein
MKQTLLRAILVLTAAAAAPTGWALTATGLFPADEATNVCIDVKPRIVFDASGSGSTGR